MERLIFAEEKKIVNGLGFEFKVSNELLIGFHIICA